MFKVGDLVVLNRLGIIKYSTWNGAVGLILKTLPGTFLGSEQEYYVMWWLTDGGAEKLVETEIDLKHV